MIRYQYVKLKYHPVGLESFEGYQEINSGSVIRNTDLDGNTVDLGSFIACDSWVIDPNPEPPVWAEELVPEPVVEDEPPVIDPGL